MLFCLVSEGVTIELHGTVWGVRSVKRGKQITESGYAVIKNEPHIFVTHAPATMKALDKSFILVISAKAKATKSCQVKFLGIMKRNEGKCLEDTQALSSLIVFFLSFLLTAVIHFIQWSRITLRGQTTFQVFQLKETGQRNMSMKYVTNTFVHTSMIPL